LLIKACLVSILLLPYIKSEIFLNEVVNTLVYLNPGQDRKQLEESLQEELSDYIDRESFRLSSDLSEVFEKFTSRHSLKNLFFLSIKNIMCLMCRKEKYVLKLLCCGTTFCRDCLLQWLISKNVEFNVEFFDCENTNCPRCNKEINAGTMWWLQDKRNKKKIKKFTRESKLEFATKMEKQFYFSDSDSDSES